MPETDQNETLRRGKDYTLKFNEQDFDDLSTFNEVTYALADSRGAGSNHVTKTETGGGITISGDANEVAEVTIDGTDTATLAAPDTYYHEVITEDGSGNEQVAATGTVRLLPALVDA